MVRGTYCGIGWAFWAFAAPLTASGSWRSQHVVGVSGRCFQFLASAPQVSSSFVPLFRGPAGIPFCFDRAPPLVCRFGLAKGLVGS